MLWCLQMRSLESNLVYMGSWGPVMGFVPFEGKRSDAFSSVTFCTLPYDDRKENTIYKLGRGYTPFKIELISILIINSASELWKMNACF